MGSSKGDSFKSNPHTQRTNLKILSGALFWKFIDKYFKQFVMSAHQVLKHV